MATTWLNALAGRPMLVLALLFAAYLAVFSVVGFILPHLYPPFHGLQNTIWELVPISVVLAAALTLLPHDIVHRKKKGFGIPLATWLRELPEEAPFRPLSGLRADYAEKAFSAHRSGEADNRLFMWSWMSLQAVSRRLEQ